MGRGVSGYVEAQEGRGVGEEDGIGVIICIAWSLDSRVPRGSTGDDSHLHLAPPLQSLALLRNVYRRQVQ